jgi:phage baseplate assembly protein W
MATKISRADTLTTVTKKEEYFSDIFDNFLKAPFGKDLARATNEKAVNQSLRNLVKTDLGERLFQPFVGSTVYESLFEMNDYLQSDILIFTISNTIRNNEPRVNLIDVFVNENEDPGYIEITIVYSLINNPDPTTLTMLLKRVR